MTTSLRLTFAEFGDGQYFIRDIKNYMYEKVINYMFDKYCLENKIFRRLGITDERNVFETYSSYVKHILLNDMSIAIVDQHDHTIYGVVLLKWMNEEWKSWTALLLSVLSGKMTDILNLYKFIVFKNKIDKLDTMHLFDLYIDEELRTDQIYRTLFDSIFQVAQLAHKRSLTTFALRESEQQLACAYGFSEMDRVIYALYELEGERYGERPFSCLRDINEFQATVLIANIYDYIPFFDMPLTKYRHQVKKKKKNVQII